VPPDLFTTLKAGTEGVRRRPSRRRLRNPTLCGVGRRAAKRPKSGIDGPSISYCNCFRIEKIFNEQNFSLFIAEKKRK
jgi:hypothetical protein